MSEEQMEEEEEDNSMSETGWHRKSEIQRWTRTRKISLAASGALVVVSIGLIIFRVQAVKMDDVLIAAAFGVYYLVVQWVSGSTEKKQEYRAVAPNVRSLRFIICLSILLSFVLPMYVLLTTADDKVRKDVARPLFWFLCERAYEITASRPSVNLLTKLILILTLQPYRLKIIYQWFLRSSGDSIWLQLLAGANLVYWISIVFGYSLLNVFASLIDTQAVKRQLESMK
eukprot:CAMPEP_0198736828 /NCGR_PEP_ID=MMETSP1475-20131203/67557_1 /TAXON_ID= ORGANISM="Unidentified sp., Strain CCMP1999" /NCGR_SAMPLE_ID=MMETSP1475 /ASSEMBLY_ACC=CAM_ASM_001111 /LENGTH=227 /DNA_ID=CAMNT_0044500679 /DNA_START=54 /DNA_END=737 /DNA_ORIENTATION=+